MEHLLSQVVTELIKSAVDIYALCEQNRSTDLGLSIVYIVDRA